MSSVFKINELSHLTRNMFLDGDVDIQRYESLKYKQFDKLTDKQLGFFWRPEEIDCTRDSKDFKDLTPFEQHIFTSNLKRQILLDSVQGRSPNLAFLPLVSLPELEAWVETWSFNETIHSRSYTHIIRNVYANPSKIFDEMTNIKEIVDCANDISRYYDELIIAGQMYNLLGVGTHTINGGVVEVSKYDLKKKIWLAINSANALEGIRFYVSFACSWAFAELKKMEGNAKLIKLICRDENVHLAATQMLLKLLPKDDIDFAQIKEETKEECAALFLQAVQQEKDWAKYLFKDGSMIGLNEQLLVQYIDWIACKRMMSLGLDCEIKVGSNPLPWTQKWISGAEVQVAPQQTQISSYTIGAINMDVDQDTFNGVSL